MKRSLAPSVQYMNKMRKIGDESSVVLPTPVKGVNHLDLYTMKPKTRDADDEEDDTTTSTDKNFVVNRGGEPVCFGVKYENLNKEQKNYMNGPGMCY